MIAKIITVIVLLFLLIPILVLIPVSLSPTTYVVFPNESYSLQWYQKLLTDRDWITSIMNSLQIAFFTTVFALIAGFIIALSLKKLSGKLKSATNEFFRLPQTIPIIVIAIAVYSQLNKFKLSGTMVGLIIAHTIIAIPFVVTTLNAGFAGLNENFENAAINLGANKIKAFFTITLPMMRGSVISACLFAFIASFDEIAVTLFITGPQVKTLPIKMYEGISQNIEPTLAAVSTIIVVIIALAFTIMGIVEVKQTTTKHKY